MKDNKGMKSPRMPQEHFQKDEGQLNPVSGMKYGTEMGNPSSLDKMTAGLANYAKKNKMKYE